MTRKTLYPVRLVIVLVAALSMGLHYAVVQIVGWVNMTVEYSQSAPLASTVSLTPGSQLKGTVEIPASGAVASVPASALLKTAEGSFVHTVNGSFYVRSPVKTGASNDQFVEITDSLFSCDQIVTTPVMSFWMTEPPSADTHHDSCKSREWNC